MKLSLHSVFFTTEIAILCYWVLALVLLFNPDIVDPAYMYSDYKNPTIIAWNWSFFPIDIAFVICGLVVKFGTFEGNTIWKIRIVESVLMICAGVMAISFWIIIGNLDFFWWSANLWLILLGASMLTLAFRK